MSGRLEGRLIGLGVTGSIAAYKAVELLRLLRTEGADVVVMLTPAATAFVGPLTFQALSRHAVETDVLALLPDGRIGHIVVADTADAIVVAPATAHWLSAMASGLSGDVVTATTLASSAPVVVAPAMDGDMWTHPATRDNVARLRDAFGYTIVEPEAGELASGQTGMGRLAELPAIVDAVVASIGSRPVRAADVRARPPTVEPVREADLTGRHLVVSAGGTRESIDPVRFIGNRSTGKMGVAIGEAALARGARVTLVAAKLDVAPPSDATVVAVESAAEMRSALHKLTHAEDGRAGFDALVMAAAVSDFRPATHGGPEAGTWRLADPRARSHPGHPWPDRPDRARHGPGGRGDVRADDAAALPRRVRGGDRLTRPGRRQAPAQVTRPARRERRVRSRFRVRDRHQPRDDPRGRRQPGGAPLDVETGGR